MLCVVVSCFVKFARDQNVWTTDVVQENQFPGQNFFFVFSDVVCCSFRLTALQTLLSSRLCSKVWQMFGAFDHSTKEQHATNGGQMLCIVG